MKMYGAVEAHLHVFWGSSLEADDWSASRLGNFILGDRTSA